MPRMSQLAPTVALAVASVAGGVVVDPFLHLAASAAAITHGAPVEAAAGYHLDLRDGNVMALAAWTLGAGILVARRVREPVAATVARAGDRFGPRRIYAVTLAGLERLADAAHREEVRDLRTSLAAVLVPTGILAALGFLNTPTDDAYAVGPITIGDLPIVALLALAVTAALTAAGDRGRLRPVLALSVLGFSLAGVYALIGAPDVALVAVVVDTVVTLVFVAVFSRLPGTTVGRPTTARPSPHRLRNAAAGVVAGGAAFAVIWTVLSRPPLGPSDAAGQIRLTPDAHGGDVVTVILADFRGLDTMVEITVLAVAILGVASLIRRGDRG